MNKESPHFRRVETIEEAEAVQRWGCAMEKFTDADEGRRAYELLREFEGSYIRLDNAILCKLEKAKAPPSWTCVTWRNHWYWAALGIHYTVFLPIQEEGYGPEPPE